MADILIRGYKAKEQIEDIIKQARYAANNCMIGSGLEIIELPEHGNLVDADELKAVAYERGKEHQCVAFVDPLDITLAPVIIPASKEETE